MLYHDEAPDRVVHISDVAFFDAVDLDWPGLGKVRQALPEDTDTAFAALLDHFLHRNAPVDPACRSAEDLMASMACHRELADLILAGGSRQFGQAVVDFSEPIDFDAPFGDQSKYGFHYLRWMECLPCAALETGDGRYIDAYLHLLRQWYEQRDRIHSPHVNHVVFYELGLAGRSRRFLDFLHAVRHLGLSDRLAPDDARILFKSLLGAGRWLTLEQTTRGYRPANWQIHGVRGLLAIGYSLPELAESAEFRKVGAEYIDAHIERDYFADGGHSERCFSYGSGAVRQIQEVTLLAEANPELTPPRRQDWRGHVARAYRWFLELAAPGGEFPGVNDGAYTDGLELLQRAAAFTGDPAYLYPVRSRLETGAPAPVEPDFGSVCLEDSGYCAMRDGWDEDGAYVLVSFGPWGGGHTHMGLLDFDLYWRGMPVVAEASRFGPYDVPWNLYFRSDRAHNQVVVEGVACHRDQVQGEEIHFGSAPAFDYFAGLHRAYEESAGVVVERRLFFLKGWGVVVSDTAFSPPRRQSYLWMLHTPFELRRGELRAEGRGSDGVGLVVQPADAGQLRRGHTGLDYDADMVAEAPHWAPDRSAVLHPERHFLALRGWNVRGDRTCFDVLLLPCAADARATAVTAVPARVEGAPPATVSPRAVQIEGGGRSLLVVHSAPGVTVTVGAPALAAEVSVAGHFAAIECTGGRPVQAHLHGVERLVVGGIDVDVAGEGTATVAI